MVLGNWGVGDVLGFVSYLVLPGESGICLQARFCVHLHPFSGVPGMHVLEIGRITDWGQLYTYIPSGAYHCHEKLYRELIRDIFTCGLCHELGTQWRYRCCEPGCNFNVHPSCGEVPKNPFITPFVYSEKKRFCFRKNPVDSNRYCVACGKRVKGYNYHYDETNVDLHPDCTRNFRSRFKVGNFRLKLQERLNGSCNHCGRSTYLGRSLNTWAYVSDHGGYQYFAVFCWLFARFRYKKA